MHPIIFAVSWNIGLYNYYGCLREKKYSKADRTVTD